jgi:endonuclease-3 related protein
VTLLAEVYGRLRARFGEGRWWPAETPFEVCLGAILTQRTSWRNVEKALDRLRRRGRLSYEGLRGIPPTRLGPWIRPAGFFRVKARRASAFVRFIGREYAGRVEEMSREGVEGARRKLLEVPGIGPETADSILLYAAGLPVFVVDAYTRRVFSRLGVISGRESYDTIQQLFTLHIPESVALYNDYHAQIVALGKAFCRRRPLCPDCPLVDLCPKKGVKGGGRRATVRARRDKIRHEKGASRFRRESRPREVQVERATGS